MFYVWLDDYKHKLLIFGLAVFLWWKHTATSVLVESFCWAVCQLMHAMSFKNRLEVNMLIDACDIFDYLLCAAVSYNSVIQTYMGRGEISLRSLIAGIVPG